LVTHASRAAVICPPISAVNLVTVRAEIRNSPTTCKAVAASSDEPAIPAIITIRSSSAELYG
jgi:hypothetical protein